MENKFCGFPKDDHRLIGRFLREENVPGEAQQVQIAYTGILRQAV